MDLIFLFQVLCVYLIIGALVSIKTTIEINNYIENNTYPQLNSYFEGYLAQETKILTIIMFFWLPLLIFCFLLKLSAQNNKE